MTDIPAALPTWSVMDNLRASVILTIRHTPPRDWPPMIRRVVIEQGGSLILPDTADSWASHMAELSLLGITGRGDNLESALCDWIKAAERTLPVPEVA
jgi:hypothetical protein